MESVSIYRTVRRMKRYRRGARSGRGRSGGLGASSVVKDKRAVALSILSRYFPFLLKEHRADVMQDVELLLLESQETKLKAFSREAQRFFYRRAREYGWRRPKGSKGFVKDFRAFPRELGEE